MTRIKKDKRGKYYFVVEAGKTLEGKRKQIRRSGFKRKKDAEKVLNEILNQIYKGDYFVPSNKLYEDLVKIWLITRKNELKPQTFKIQNHYIKNHLLDKFGKAQISKIKKMHIQQYMNELSEKGLAPSTVKKIHSLLKLSLDFAVSFELIKENPALDITLPRQERVQEINVWDEEQVKCFLKTARGTHYECFYHLALKTGMRFGEILGLKWKNIDFNKKIIFVQQTITPDGKVFNKDPKTIHSRRTIKITDSLTNQLIRQQKRIQKFKNELKDDFQDNDLVICSFRGTPLNQSNIRRNFNRLIEKANLPKIRIHDLRHTHATLLLSKNVNPKVAAERLGHADTRMTLDIYSHLLPNMQDAAVEALNDIFD